MFANAGPMTPEQAAPHLYRWKGKAVADMTHAELVAALIKSIRLRVLGRRAAPQRAGAPSLSELLALGLLRCATFAHVLALIGNAVEFLSRVRGGLCLSPHAGPAFRRWFGVDQSAARLGAPVLQSAGSAKRRVHPVSLTQEALV